MRQIKKVTQEQKQEQTQKHAPQQTTLTVTTLPETGLLRSSQIIGDRAKGLQPLIPVSRSNWWSGVKSGRYPQPIKLSPRITCWRAQDIRQLIEQLSEKAGV